MLDRISLILTIIGALNWGLVGLFKFDAVAWLFGGQAAIVSRIIYTLVALAGIWCISLLFRENAVLRRAEAVLSRRKKIAVPPRGRGLFLTCPGRVFAAF